MDYRAEETLYGPEIRFNDWRLEKGEKDRGGGALLLIGEPEASVIRDDLPYGGGGDVALSIGFEIEGMGEKGSIAIRFNRGRSGQDVRGFLVEIDRERLRVTLAGEEIASRDCGAGTEPGPHRIELATLYERFLLRYDDSDVAGGTMKPPYTDNEGWLSLACREANLRVLSVQEQTIQHPAPAPPWERAEALYVEDFREQSFHDNWICNRAGEEGIPVFRPNSYLFRHMSNCLIRRPFSAPIAVDFTARPVPSEKHSAGVTDAIFIWMAQHPSADLLDFLDRQTAQGKADLRMLLPCPFYWVDFGGTNNVTTRLRKNPQRHLMRQYTDAPRLLARDHTYQITVVQNNGFVEFWVDGEPMIRIFDPEAIETGRVGIRAYCADLEISGLSVWRITSPKR